MENKKLAIQEDHFLRLPEELILYIFNRVIDLKSLFMCSLVSKHFASVISHVRTVTIPLPGNEAHTMEYYKRTFTLFREIRHLKTEQIPAHLDMLSLQNLKLPVFLESFSKLESVYLEYKSARNAGNSSLIMWKVKCSSNAMIEKFVAVLPTSIQKKTEYELEQEQVSPENSLSCITSQITNCFWLSYGCYTEWLCLVCMLIKSHLSLQIVTVLDPDRRCRLVVKTDQLSHLRNCSHEPEREEIALATKFKMARVPLLHLPLSGYVLRGVCLIMAKIPRDSCASDEQDAESDDLTAWDFDKQENLLRETVKEILENHQDKVRVSG